MSTQHKAWSRSRTIWFGVGTGLASTGSELMFMADLLPEAWQIPVRIGLGVITAIGIVILRVITDSPIGAR
ncbi:MAG: hypothetical protein OEZ19_00125 [Paracoccaceae bacterium]|nr:hypothetical protein [Paracoccaceae bacterium]